MAGEYSRELSAKVFKGQCRLIQLGFRQGGQAGYGLRRILVDQHGNVKGELARGEPKSIQTDRVILTQAHKARCRSSAASTLRFVAGSRKNPSGRITCCLNAEGIACEHRSPLDSRHRAPGAHQREVHRQ